MEYEKGLAEDHVKLLKLIQAELKLQQETPSETMIVAMYVQICTDRRMFWINEKKNPSTAKPAAPIESTASEPSAEETKAAAEWRNEPASDKQKTTMNSCKIPFIATITKGQASDLIDEKFSKKK